MLLCVSSLELLGLDPIGAVAPPSGHLPLVRLSRSCLTERETGGKLIQHLSPFSVEAFHSANLPWLCPGGPQHSHRLQVPTDASLGPYNPLRLDTITCAPASLREQGVNEPSRSD